MAIYDAGTASLAADGTVNGVGTTWRQPLTLIRVGATMIFNTTPASIVTIAEIISDTEIRVFNDKGFTAPTGTQYSILAHDGITVQGLAQDVAETLRYYQSRETEVAEAVDAFNQFDGVKFKEEVNQVNTQYQQVVTDAAQVAADAIQVSSDKDIATEQANSSSYFAGVAQNAANSVSGALVLSFDGGGTIESKTQQVFYFNGNDVSSYLWNGPLPKTIPENSTPESTGGVAPGAWVAVGDNSLRDQLLSSSGGDNVRIGERTLTQNINDINRSGNYADFQTAINSTEERNDMLITSGIYTGEYYSGSANLIGVGYGARFNPGPNQASFTLTESSRLWQYRHASNFLIQGEIGTRDGIGITFGQSNTDGRWNFDHIAFDSLDIGLRKPKGNIGNTYQHCSYLECNYGHIARSDVAMHTGSDTWRDCHFAGIHTYGIYIDGSTLGGSLQGSGVDGVSIRDCTFEACPGGGIYFKGNGVTPTVTPTISNVWLEGVATEQAVIVDGVSQKPRQLKLENMPMVVAENCYLNNIELKGSTLLTKNCRIDNASGVYDISIDAGSRLIARDLIIGGYVGGDILVESIADNSFPLSQGLSASVRATDIKGRIRRSSVGGVLHAKTFSDAGPWRFLGTGTVDATAVADGVLSDSCAQLSIPAGYTLYLDVPTANIAQYYQVVWGCSLKVVSGDVSAAVADSILIGEIYTKPNGNWIHTYGVGQASISGTARLRFQSTNGGVVRISDYFLAQFPNKTDAYTFANSRMSVIG
ncbi:hypothetical protein [Escherichia phage vB-EcoS-XT34]|nr:hypothetical protein [Escherichia phage vB-EcoS-XT34]